MQQYHAFVSDVLSTSEYRDEDDVALGTNSESRPDRRPYAHLLKPQSFSQRAVPQKQMIGDLTKGNLGHIFTEPLVTTNASVKNTEYESRVDMSWAGPNDQIANEKTEEATPAKLATANEQAMETD